MQILTKLILVCFSIAFYVGAVFLFNEPSVTAGVTREEIVDNSRGRVLGISEVVTPEDKNKKESEIVYYGLPENRAKRLTPERKEQSIAIDLPTSVGVVIDAKSGSVLFEKDAEKIVPIASITKLATAIVFLEENVDFDKIHEITDKDRVNGGRIYLHRGDKVKVKDLFYLSLVGSANSATQALVNSTGLDTQEFVKKMNIRMKSLELYNTAFEDVVGLGVNNKSNAIEVARLTKIALNYPEIKEATMLPSYRFFTEQGKSKIVHSTDSLLESFDDDKVKILGGKTGYTESAGYCFAGKYVDDDGNELLSVVLQEVSENSRFEKSKMLALWAFDSYLW
jgi:D-alanyl-D-alanine carboxypeptidase